MRATSLLDALKGVDTGCVIREPSLNIVLLAVLGPGELKVLKVDKESCKYRRMDK